MTSFSAVPGAAAPGALAPGAPGTAAAPSGPAVAAAWSASYAAPSGFGSYPPAAPSLQAPVSNRGAGGNWLFALCAWRTPPGVQSTVAVGDDSFNRQPGCNVWEPLGAPAGTSPLAGNTAASVWYCRNALAAQNVYVSPSGLVTSMCVLVVEMSGLSPWASPAGIATGYAPASASSPALSLAAPGAQAVLLAVMAGDDDAVTLTWPGTPWTALGAVVASDGVDSAADCVLGAVWQVTSSPSSASWNSSPAADMAGVLTGVLVSPPAPVPPSQTWPYMQFQAGFGAGAQTPWDQVAWTDLTSRWQGGSGQRGKQYELDSIQAGTFSAMLSNNDGALNPGNAASPYPGVNVYTPARLLATWPPPPDASARTYSVWRGLIERWPSSLTAARYQVANTTGTDVYALLTTLMQSLPRAEVLADEPYAYWPLADAEGSTAAANLAKGNSQQLQAVQSKYGAGGATSAFGVSVPYLAGDPSASGWQQASVPAGLTQGWCLYYLDTGLPPVAGGVTAEGWFALATAQPSGATLILIAVRNSTGSILKVQVTPAGLLQVSVRDRITGAFATTAVSAASVLTGIPVHVAVAFTATAWTLYLDGGAVAAASGSCNLAASGYWLVFGGAADRGGASGFANVTVAHLAVYPYVLQPGRIASHWYAAVTAMTGQDTAGPRADRLLADGGAAVPRIMPPGSDLFTGAMDIAAQAVSQNVVNVAESDSAWLMVNSAGYLALQDRRGGYNLPVQWAFGELEGLGADEYAYLGDIATDCDPSQAYNDLTLTQLSAPAVTATALSAAASSGAASLTVADASAVTAGQVLLLDPGTTAGELVTVTAVTANVLAVTATAYAHAANAAVSVISQSATGVTVTAADPASIGLFGDQTLQQTSYLSDPGAVADQAWWIVNTTGTPVNRIANMTLDPAANPALWPVVLGLETGQVVWVSRRLQGTQTVMSGQFQVMSVAHSPGPRTWTTKVALLPYPGQVLACDDPSYGVPGALNSLGW